MNTDESECSLRPELENLTGSIIGAAFEVSNTLGHGFLESVYRKAMVHELSIRGLSVAEEVPFDVVYKQASLGKYYCDLLVEKMIIVELKAIDRLDSSHVGQLLNYLRASRLNIGLLLNFGRPRLQYRRVLL